jgi:exonuclease III
VEGSQNSKELGCFNPGKSASQEPTYDIGIDFGIGRKQFFCNDEELSGEMLDSEYREMVQSLNTKQKEFFYHILHLAKTKQTPIYNFLSGGAGVGKSVLLKALYQALLKYYSRKPGENPDECKILVCAPTGKAAYNVGGLTIHSAFNIPADQGFKFKPLDMQQLCTFQTKYKSLKIVFIDEISMVGKRMFNFINLRLQEIMGCTRPFGGVSVIVFGDLFQLKPVMDSWIFASGYRTSCELEILGPNLWQDLFSFFELDEIMRQKEDLRFAQLLNRLREGNQSSDDIKLLNDRTIQDDNQVTMAMTHLFTRKLEVSNFNRRVFDEMHDVKKTIVEAIDTISGEIASSLKDKILSKIPLDTNKTKGLAKYLHLAEDLPAELCINIDTRDGLTNGTPCTIKKLDFRVEGFKRCSIVWVLFHSCDIGKKCRKQFSHLYNCTITQSWTPIIEVTRKFQFNYYNSFQITRRQFPIALASAKTVHKAQGCTLPSAVIHLGSKKLEHMYYVALSRVQKLSSLYLLGFDDGNIKVSMSVMEEMCRLRCHAQADLSVRMLYFESGYKIVYHNTRSLHKHIDDLRSDFLIKSANILGLSETRLKKDELSSVYSLLDYKMHRSDDKFNTAEERPCHGIAVYHKNSSLFFENVNLFGVDLVFGNILYKENLINLCFVYCPPKNATVQILKKVFDKLHTKFNKFQTPIIIMGDFNINLHQNEKFVNNVDQKYGLKQYIKTCTTDYGTLIDHLYTNIDAGKIISVGTLESYYSDHKPIYINIL